MKHFLNSARGRLEDSERYHLIKFDELLLINRGLNRVSIEG